MGGKPERPRWKKRGGCRPRRVVVKDLGYDGDEDEEFDFFDEE